MSKIKCKFGIHDFEPYAAQDFIYTPLIGGGEGNGVFLFYRCSRCGKIKREQITGSCARVFERAGFKLLYHARG